MLQPGHCHNKCCQSQPCQNEGSCIEHCKSPKEKFTCLCPNGYYGKVCENEFHSCKDILLFHKTLPKDGVYQLRNKQSNRLISVYCAFNAPNQAWALIESFSLENNFFKSSPFFETFGINYDLPPSWENFRMIRGRMTYISSLSTLFRATCDFPKRSSSSLTPDLLIGELREVNLISEHIDGCKRFMFIDIKGHQCRNCTAFTYQGGTVNAHFHIDVTHNRCEYKPPILFNTDNFGYYGSIDKTFTCTLAANSTTQYWLGQEI